MTVLLHWLVAWCLDIKKMKLPVCSATPCVCQSEVLKARDVLGKTCIDGEGNIKINLKEMRVETVYCIIVI